MQEISRVKTFAGEQCRFTHPSVVCDCEMTFSVFLPPGAQNSKVPVLYWLSGLTCTDENFSTKAGAQRVAAELGLMLVIPDTSPRGVNLPGEDDSYDFGSGAGFYLNATEPPWNRHYRMYDYVVEELPALVEQHFPAEPGLQSISGHSMGGHGALTIALKNPDAYRSVSAFAPIVAPSQVPWGQKALGGYLGDDESTWRDYDATALMLERGYQGEILIDQGAADQFLTEHLKPELFELACKAQGVELTLNLREGYDHSYYFIASFIEEHLRFHAERLQG